jgi:hypothetical protein
MDDVPVTLVSEPCPARSVSNNCKWVGARGNFRECFAGGWIISHWLKQRRENLRFSAKAGVYGLYSHARLAGDLRDGDSPDAAGYE